MTIAGVCMRCFREQDVKDANDDDGWLTFREGAVCPDCVTEHDVRTWVAYLERQVVVMHQRLSDLSEARR